MKTLAIYFTAIFLICSIPTLALAGPHDINSNIPITWSSYNSSFSEKEPLTDGPVILFFAGIDNAGENVFHTAAIREINQEYTLVHVSYKEWELAKSWGIDPKKNQPAVIFLDQYGNEFGRIVGTFKSRSMCSIAASKDSFFKKKIKKHTKQMKRIKKAIDKGKGAGQIKALKKIMDDIKGYEIAVEAEELYNSLIDEGMDKIEEIVTTTDLPKIKKQQLRALLKFYKNTEVGKSIGEAIKDLTE